MNRRELESKENRYNTLKVRYEQSLKTLQGQEHWRKQNEALLAEKNMLQQELNEAETEGIMKDADIERLEYWVEEYREADKNKTCDCKGEDGKLQKKHNRLKALYERALRDMTDHVKLQDQNEALSRRVSEAEADIAYKELEIERLEESGSPCECLLYNTLKDEHDSLQLKYGKLEQSMDDESEDSTTSISNTRKRLSKAAKKNRNLLAIKEGLKAQVSCLEGQVQILKSEAEEKAALVKVGAAIRLRYLELEKVDRLGITGRLDRSVIEAGNDAAHTENGAADWAVLHTKLGSTAAFGEVFHAIYGLDYAAYTASRYCLCRPCELGAEVNRFFTGWNTESRRAIVSSLHDEIHAMNGGIHDEHQTVEGDSKSAVLISRLEALTNEILAIDVPGHGWTPKTFVPLDKRDYEVSYSGWGSVWIKRYHYKEDTSSKLDSEFPSLKEMEMICRDSVFVDY